MPIKNAFCQCLHSFSLCMWAQSYFVLTKVEQTSLNQISMFYITVSFRLIMFVSSFTDVFNISIEKNWTISYHSTLTENFLGIQTVCCWLHVWFLIPVGDTTSSRRQSSPVNIETVLKGKVYSTVFILNEMYLCLYWRPNWLNTLGM